MITESVKLFFFSYCKKSDDKSQLYSMDPVNKFILDFKASRRQARSGKKNVHIKLGAVYENQFSVYLSNRIFTS